MRVQSRKPDEILARLASRSAGVVSRAELLAAGVSPGGIERRLRRGSLIRVHRGVYRVGHRAPSPEARCFAAVKACGDGAVVSGLSAAHLWGLVKRAPDQVEVSTPTERRVPGVRARRSRRLDRRDVTTCRGLAVTTVPRTLVDLAAALEEDDLALACHEAGVLYRTTPRQVKEALERSSRPPGAGLLRRVIDGDVPVTLSKLEREFLRLVTEAGLPPPQTNRRVSGRRVDCRWPAHRLTVELDSYRYHNSRHAWKHDRVREREARGRGDELVRFTWEDVTETPSAMLADLADQLRRRAPRR